MERSTKRDGGEHRRLKSEFPDFVFIQFKTTPCDYIINQQTKCFPSDWCSIMSKVY